MKQKRSWIERLSDRADLPTMALPGLPLVELAGENRILVENHGGITEYGPCRIRVRVRFGQICISGQGLLLTKMTREQLVISGKIDAVTLTRRDC